MRTVYLATFAIVILAGVAFTPLGRYTRTLRAQTVLVFDQLAAVRFFPLPVRTEHIARIEQKNRQLYAQLASCRAAISSASTSALMRPVLHTHSSVSSLLSYSGGQWIILSGSDDRLRVGDVVIIDTVFLGTLSRVTPTYSDVAVVSTLSLPLLVQHESSKAVAVLRSEKNQVFVQFSKERSDVVKDDLFVTIPDGKHTHQPYPIATVGAILSGNSESMTLVEVHPIANPLIGSTVQILLSED